MLNGGRIGPRTATDFSGVWTAEEVFARRLNGAWPSFSQDTFDVDSTSQYTQSADSNGTWSIASGELTATGGTQAVFIRNGTSYSDVVIEADVNQAHDGGLVLRFINNSNYYMLFLGDDSSVTPTQNLKIFKRVSGTFTDIGNADITWTRGTPKTVRFSASGTTLKALVNGVEVLSVTDSAHAGPGGVGLRNNSSTATKFQAFRWNIT